MTLRLNLECKHVRVGLFPFCTLLLSCSYSNRALCDNVTLLVLDNKARVYQPLIDQVALHVEYQRKFN